MATVEVLRDDSNSSDSYPSGEYSLLHEVGEPYTNGDANHINFDFTNLHSTMNGAICENADVSSQITKLISNNLSMKEALDKNNLMMKEQLSNLPSLIDSKLEEQKQKAEEMISSLKNENALLQNKLDSLLELSKDKEVKDFCIKCETFETAVNTLFGDKDFIKEDEVEVKMFHADLEQNLLNICQHLNSTLKSKMDENLKKSLETFVRLLKFKIAALNETFSATVQTDEETGYEIIHQKVDKEESIKKSLDVASEAQKKIENLERSLKLKDEELNLLKKEKEQFCETMKACGMKIQELEEALKTKFEDMRTKLNMESSVSEKYKGRCDSLQQHLEEYQVKLDKAKISEEVISNQFRQEIHDLQEILKVEQEAYQAVKDELSRTMVKFEKLQVDYETASKLLEIGSRDEKEKIEKMQAASSSNEKVHLEKIDYLTAQLLEARELYSESDATVTEMRRKLELVANEAETIPILKTQIEVYKRDYEISENARKAAEDEVEKLTNELKKLKQKFESNTHETHATVTELRKRLERVAIEAETIPILKNQIEAYKRDFEISEKAKKAAQDEVEKLTNELKKLKQKFESNSHETHATVTDLRQRLERVADEAETIPILKTQIDVYKRDYEISENARKAAEGEVEKLTNELKKFKQNPVSNSQETSTSSSRKSFTVTSLRKEDPYRQEEVLCPICSAGFFTVNAATNHIHRCLQKQSK